MGIKRIIKSKDFKWCLGITLMTLVWVGVAPIFYRVITTGSWGIWLKNVYLIFNQSIWLFIPVLVCLVLLFFRLHKKGSSSKSFQVHWLFAIAFGFVVLFCCQPPFDYAIIWWNIDYRHLFSTWLGLASIFTLWWMIKLIVEKVRNKKPEKTLDSHDEVPGFSLDNNRVIQHSDPVKLYADSIVEKLKNTESSKDEAFAIGITSEWGAGKTTFLDLLSNKITEEGFAEILPFNPWMCQSPEQVTRDFFSSLRHQLSDKYPELSNPIKKYARYLGAISVPVHGIAKIKFNNLATEKSLYKMKLELSERFSNLDKRVVVTIDDLDRLDSDEVFEVLRLIRNTASLSSVIYLVAYDKAYIIKVLENKNISSPSAYLEKIFQLEIQLPIVQKGQVWNAFVNDLQAQLPNGFDISFVKRDKELIEKVLNTYRRAERFARLLSLSYLYYSIQMSLNDFDKNDILLLDLLHMDDKKVYDILSFRPKEILELDNGRWIYERKKDGQQNIKLSDGSSLKLKETSNEILMRLWGKQEDSQLGQYSIRREECLEEYFTLNVQFSNRDIKAMIDSDDVDVLISDWYKKGKSLDGMPDKINSYPKEGLNEQQGLNLLLGLLSYYYVRNRLDIYIKVDEIVPMLKGNTKKLIEWFDTKMNDKCDYLMLSRIAAVLVKSGRINEEDSKGLIEKMVDRLFEYRRLSILDILRYDDLLEFLHNYSLLGNPMLARIAYNRIIFICHNETNKPTMDAFCAEYNKNRVGDENSALKRVFDEDWKWALCILFNNCIDQTGIIDEKDKASLSLIEWIKRESIQYSIEYWEKGSRCYNEGDYNIAEENYNEAIRIRPDYESAYINRGKVYHAQFDFDKAIADYTMALSILFNDNTIVSNEHLAEICFNLGNVYKDKGEYDNAKEEYLAAIMLWPYDGICYKNLAVVCCQLNDYESAIHASMESIALSPNESSCYDVRCSVYMAIYDWDKAMKDAQKGLELAQRDNDTETIKLLEEKIKQIEEALKPKTNNNK